MIIYIKQNFSSLIILLLQTVNYCVQSLYTYSVEIWNSLNSLQQEVLLVIIVNLNR